MNKENLIKTRDAILAHKERFKYSTYFYSPINDRMDALVSDKHTCGTVGCVAGFAYGLAIQEGLEPLEVSYTAKEYLGIERPISSFLFYAQSSCLLQFKYGDHPKFRDIPRINLRLATYQDAVDRLNLLIDLCD